MLASEAPRLRVRASLARIFVSWICSTQLITPSLSAGDATFVLNDCSETSAYKQVLTIRACFSPASLALLALTSAMSSCLATTSFLCVSAASSSDCSSSCSWRLNLEIFVKTDQAKLVKRGNYVFIQSQPYLELSSWAPASWRRRLLILSSSLAISSSRLPRAPTSSTKEA